jgi:hypothetical protein
MIIILCVPRRSPLTPRSMGRSRLRDHHRHRSTARQSTTHQTGGAPSPHCYRQEAARRFRDAHAGDILVSLANSTVTVQAFQITGPYTNLKLSGGAPLKSPQSLNLKANGNLKLEVQETFDKDIFSPGVATTAADARVTLTGKTSRSLPSGNVASARNFALGPQLLGSQAGRIDMFSVLPVVYALVRFFFTYGSTGNQAGDLQTTQSDPRPRLGAA